MKTLLHTLLCLGTALTALAANEAGLYQKLVTTKQTAHALALVKSGDAALPYLNKGLKRRDRVATLCAWALAQHPNAGAAPALRARLLDVDQVAGYYAARALGKMPSPETTKALAALLPEEANEFWELSSNGVGRLRDAWDEQRNRYHEPAPPSMANLRTAYSAMEALGELGGAQAASTLSRALRNDQYLIRYGAARGLGRMRHRSSLSILKELAQNDPVLLVRRAAQQALAVIQDDTLAARTNILNMSPLWIPSRAEPEHGPALPNSIAFIKTHNRSEATLGFRDSYFFPKTPRYHSGENLYTLSPPEANGTLRNLTQLSEGEVQGLEVSYDGTKLLFAMRRNKYQDGFHIFEINTDGSNLRQITDGNCNDVDPCYLPDSRIAFCSDRAGWQEYYHQERSRLIHVMNADGSGIEQITFNPNQDYEPWILSDGRVSYSSYRFYAQDGSEGPLPGERMGLARIETVLRTCNPDGSADQLFYGSMRGRFYSPMRPMPFGDQYAGWHPRGYHVGVSVSQQRELSNGNVLCTTPAGLTVVDAARAPIDCELPIYPEVVNLAGGEEVYIHNYDRMNPVGRYTTPYPAGNQWTWVSHAPWHDLRGNAYGINLLNLLTRELRLIYDDPEMSEVDPTPIIPRPRPATRPSTLASHHNDSGHIYCNSVFDTDLPVDTSAIRSVRILEGVQMGQSIAANAAFRTRLIGTVPIHTDGSFSIKVPANIPLRFELVDADGNMLAHETAFNYVRPGETRGCVGCHQPQKKTPKNLRPLALDHPPIEILREPGDLIYMGTKSRPYNRIYRD